MVMLSYILGVMFRFERTHGFLPNRLYLNRDHARCLYAELGKPARLNISQQFGLTVIIHPDIAHPQAVHLFCPGGPVADIQ